MAATLKRFFFSIAVLGILLTVAAVGTWHLLKAKWAISEFTVSGLSLNRHGLGVKTLLIRQQSPEQERLLTLNAISLNRQSLTIDALTLHLTGKATRASAYALPQDLTHLLPKFAPQQLIIKQLTLELPCAALRCTLKGALTGQAIDHKLTARLSLYEQDHLLEAELNAHLKPIGPLELTLSLNQTPKAWLKNDLIDGQWHGTLKLEPLPEIVWLMPLLANWLPQIQQWPNLPQASINAAWQAQPIATLELAALQEANLTLAIALEQPWQLAGIGTLTGHTDLELRHQTPNWQLRRIAADLLLDQPPWELPQAYKPRQLHLLLSPLSQAPLSAQMALTLLGPVSGRVEGAAEIDVAKRTLVLNQAAFDLNAQKLNLGELSFTQAQAKGLAELSLSPEQSTLVTRSPWLLAAKAFNAQDLKANDIKLMLSPDALNLSFEGSNLVYSGEGHFDLSTSSLRHPTLIPNAWNWQGHWQLEPKALSLDAKASNQPGLMLVHRLNYPFGQRAELSFESNIEAPNSLKKSLTHWPPALDLKQGQIAVHGSLSWPVIKVNAKASLEGLSGIYDTSEFTELSAPLSLELNNNQLNIQSPRLSLKHLNSGVGLGPLEASVNFVGPLDKLDQGLLELVELNSQFLGGKVKILKEQLDLAKPKAISLNLEGLDIDALLTAYPAEGLQGSGKLDGRLPVLLSQSGVSIDRGVLRSRAPGGHLAFNSAKLTALGKSNPAMKIAADALANFHFHTLNADVSLSPSGQLNLGLNLAGQNPDLEQGRPINFTINLEEDLPALFKSLQLSGKVSEEIERKVRQQLNPTDNP